LIVGYKVNKTNPNPQRLPLTLGKKPRAWLWMVHGLDLDSEGLHLMSASSSYDLFVTEDEHREALVGIDYTREPANEYPAVHLHVDGIRDDLDAACGQSTKLIDLHLPVGGKRYRPVLEDLIEFAILEGMADPRDGWEKALKEHRERWFVLQLKAAVRRHPDIAADQLKKAGYTLTGPES